MTCRVTVNGIPVTYVNFWTKEIYKAGTTLITAKSSNGRSAYCTVTVTK